MAAIVVMTTLLAPRASGAAENDRFSIYPTSTSDGLPRAFFTMDLVPGAVIQDSVSVLNKTDESLTLDLYPADAIPTSDGSFVLKQEDDEQTGVGSWILLPQDEITIPPSSETQVPFNLIVPEDVEPGDYAGAIVVLDRATGDRATTEDNVALNVQSGVGTRVYGRVAGDLHPSLEVTNIEVQPDQTLGSAAGATTTATLAYTITNTGNTRMVPIVEAKIAGPFGVGERKVPPRTLPDLLPGGSVTVREEVAGVRAWMVLTATVKAMSPDQQTSDTGNGRALFIPWILFAILGLLIGEVLRRRRRARPAPLPTAGHDAELVGS